MNLNSAVFDNVLAIDERLRQLEQEVSVMDQYYAARPLPPLAAPATLSDE
jgi:hypothetical protein